MWHDRIYELKEATSGRPDHCKCVGCRKRGRVVLIWRAVAGVVDGPEPRDGPPALRAIMHVHCEVPQPAMANSLGLTKAMRDGLGG